MNENAKLSQRMIWALRQAAAYGVINSGAVTKSTVAALMKQGLIVDNVDKMGHNTTGDRYVQATQAGIAIVHKICGQTWLDGIIADYHALALNMNRNRANSTSETINNVNYTIRTMSAGRVAFMTFSRPSTDAPIMDMVFSKAELLHMAQALTDVAGRLIEDDRWDATTRVR